MDRLPASSRWFGRAAIVLAMAIAGGPARGEEAPASAASLDRAAALVEDRSFDRAAAVLRRILSADPANRRAREMLAFALESNGDLEGERRVRSDLAVEFPSDPRVLADYGRVLERSGDEGEALRAYRRARELSDGRSNRDLDTAIRRMRGRTALEVGMPLAVMSDPDAAASRVQAGAAVPLGSRSHVTLLGSRFAAEARSGPEATTAHSLGLSLVLRQGHGTHWTVGPSVHAVASRGGARKDIGAGGSIAGRAAFGPSLEAEWSAGVETPWDEAAVAILRGGRTTFAEGHLFSHLVSRRLLLQAGGRRRRLSIVANPGSARRPEVWQSLGVVGADLVVWRKPGAALRGEMLDETLTAPTAISSAVTLAYRHYEVSTRTTPEFIARIGLVPHGSVDEGSVATTFVPAQGRVGLSLRAGLARDAARGARTWRVGGGLALAPGPATRVGLAYEAATEAASGLVGRRREGWLSVHVDF